MWLVVGYFVMTIAELCLSPIGLSLVSKLAPKQFLSLMMGSWFLTSFFGNMIAGFWGGKYGVISTTTIFGILALITLFSSIILKILSPRLNKILKH
jgi:POT family proton-dependent oligopeptide transporter